MPKFVTFTISFKGENSQLSLLYFLMKIVQIETKLVFCTIALYSIDLKSVFNEACHLINLKEKHAEIDFRL